MNYNKLNLDFYDTYSLEYENEKKDFFRNTLLRYAERFIENLSGENILDLGCGPGRDSEIFESIGLQSICLDISKEMIKLCKEKKLEGVVGDLENLPIQENYFDGVWASTSLLHIPKSKLKGVLESTNKLLKDGGILYISMKKGNSEGEFFDERYDKKKRFYALYQENELKEYLSKSFKNIKLLSEKEEDFLHLLCMK